MYQSKKNDKKEIEVKCKNLNTKKSTLLLISNSNIIKSKQSHPYFYFLSRHHIVGKTLI